MNDINTFRQRKSIRLQGFDYGSSGAYFITILSYKRRHRFSAIKNGEVLLSPIGKIIREEWLSTKLIRDYVTLDEFVIMPDHFHAVLFLHKGSDEPDHLRSTGTYLHFPDGYKNALGPQSHNLASIVRGFKSSVTQKAKLSGEATPIWHGRYYERIVRNEKELDKFRLYIKNNPHKWGTEDEHPFVPNRAA
ncbi:MAG TPA: transposase [Bacteroidia bacterium]|jgi:REP element-mobilizing transposase RayT|nr:transposase [Bacteroidia bacterium]